MACIRVTKEFSFEMAHALFGYDGKCENIHGHSYHLSVTIRGTPIEGGDPKNGMVIDFGDLKKIVEKNILDSYDHALVINDRDDRLGTLAGIRSKVMHVPFQPTSENLVLEFVRLIKMELVPGLKLHAVKLRETATSIAEWNEYDNQ